MDAHGQAGDAVSFASNMGAVLKAIDTAAEHAVDRVAMAVESKARANVRDKLNTTGVAAGDLMNSVTHTTVKAGMKSHARVGSKLIYARIHEFGGTIEAKNGEYLTFQTADGEWHMVPSVTIPARPYLRPAALEGQAALGSVFAEEMRKWVR